MAEITLQAFRDFAASKPTQEMYPYYDCDRCACAQFAAANRVRFGGVGWFPFNDIASVQPHTFGALTQRLDAALAKVS